MTSRIGLMELADMFPDEAAAKAWFEENRWLGGAQHPHRGPASVSTVANGRPMSRHRRDCRKHFCVRTGTVMGESKFPLRKWVFAMHLCATGLKGVSGTKLHRDLDITQKTAWFLARRIQARGRMRLVSMPRRGRRDLHGRETEKHAQGQARACPTAGRSARWLSPGRRPTRALQSFVRERAEPGTKVHTDKAHVYRGMADFDYEAVDHSVGQHVSGQAYTNEIKPFRAMLKRGCHGTFHHFSAGHMQRYVNGFAARHSLRECDKIGIMTELVARMIGGRLTRNRLTGNAAA